MLRSRLCTQDQFQDRQFIEWCRQLREQPRFHRKLWEFCYICQALWERGMLRPGRRGLGFGVGQEPLPALFASYGCEIVGTDMDASSAQKAGWANSKQHMQSTQILNQRGLCEPETFRRRVSGRVVDMNAIPADLRDFDFVWSACSLEHVGSIDLGLDFILNSLDCLRPGGVAVHTTEFNVSSNRETLDQGGTVLFRRRDFEDLVDRLTEEGHLIDLGFELGAGPADYYVDVPPYAASMHLKLQLDRYVTTSIGLIIRKAGAEKEPWERPSAVRLEAEPHSVYCGEHTAVATVLGRFPMLVDTRDLTQGPALLLDGIYDPPQTQALQRLLRPGMTVVDVGAGSGYFSLLAVSLTGPDGMVHALESAEGPRALLRRNASWNGYGDRIQVQRSTAPEDLASAGGKVDLVRIAMSGAGRTALECIRHILRAARPVLLIDWNGCQEDAGESAESLAGILQENKYVALDIGTFLRSGNLPWSPRRRNGRVELSNLVCVASSDGRMVVPAEERAASRQPE